MLRLLTLTVGLACGFAAASAADLPVQMRAAPVPFAYPYNGSGFYLGLGTFGEAQSTQVNVLAPGTKGYAAGGGGSLIAGYQRTFGGGSTWLAVEAAASYANTGVDSSCALALACSINARFSASQKVKLGGPLTSLLSFLPDLATDFPALPMIPGGVGNPTTHNYIMAVAHETREEVVTPIGSGKKTAVRAGFGAGILTQLKAGMVLDTWAEVTFPAGRFDVVPGATANAGGQARAGMSVLW